MQDQTCVRKLNFECKSIESITIDLIMNNRKWLISGMYRPPSMSDSEFSKDSICTFDKASTKYENCLLLGDINYDMLNENKNKVMKEVCDIFDLTNLVNGPTCFTKGASPSLNDLILTTEKISA